VGIVAAVTAFLSRHNCNIKNSAQFGDAETGLFFMRVHYAYEQDAPQPPELRLAFQPLAESYGMDWRIFCVGERCRTAILVSRHGHCLNDLFYRYRIGSLPMDIVAVISNHRDFQDITEWHGIPFHYLPVTAETRAEQEASIRRVLTFSDAELVILARYMQVLSEDMCRFLHGRCINIHHSFLPSFKGAHPYRQAYARGVKIIGATAHYVTATLDDGPIIEQGVERVDHAHTEEDFVTLGRDVECVVLARAVRYHIERRVLLNGRKTVILR
jgi:formyltetrahydrofolate deformylase